MTDCPHRDDGVTKDKCPSCATELASAFSRMLDTRTEEQLNERLQWLNRRISVLLADVEQYNLEARQLIAARADRGQGTAHLAGDSAPPQSPAPSLDA